MLLREAGSLGEMYHFVINLVGIGLLIAGDVMQNAIFNAISLKLQFAF